MLKAVGVVRPFDCRVVVFFVGAVEFLLLSSSYCEINSNDTKREYDWIVLGRCQLVSPIESSSRHVLILFT